MCDIGRTTVPNFWDDNFFVFMLTMEAIEAYSYTSVDTRHKTTSRDHTRRPITMPSFKDRSDSDVGLTDKKKPPFYYYLWDSFGKPPAGKYSKPPGSAVFRRLSV